MRRNSPYHSSFLLQPQSPHISTAGAAARNYDKISPVILQSVFHKNICREAVRNARRFEGGETMVCPACASRGNCTPHANCTRSLIEYEGAKLCTTGPGSGGSGFLMRRDELRCRRYGAETPGLTAGPRRTSGRHRPQPWRQRGQPACQRPWG